jgi:hypothetical protein
MVKAIIAVVFVLVVLSFVAGAMWGRKLAANALDKDQSMIDNLRKYL